MNQVQLQSRRNYKKNTRLPRCLPIFFKANTLYLSNMKRNPLPLACTQPPLQPLDYKDSEMNQVQLQSRHKIRNPKNGGLKPSTPPLSQRDPLQY